MGLSENRLNPEKPRLVLLIITPILKMASYHWGYTVYPIFSNIPCHDQILQIQAKKKRGSHRPKGPVIPPLDPNASEAEIKAARAARKTAELEEFRARAAKGATVVVDLDPST